MHTIRCHRISNQYAYEVLTVLILQYPGSGKFVDHPSYHHSSFHHIDDIITVHEVTILGPNFTRKSLISSEEPIDPTCIENTC